VGDVIHEAYVRGNGLREGDWFVSQCLEVDVASQGETEEQALANLKEALELHFEPPVATRPPAIRTVEVEVGAA
jgi:predicted RNase H-like HicB family nuclease